MAKVYELADGSLLIVPANTATSCIRRGDMPIGGDARGAVERLDIMTRAVRDASSYVEEQAAATKIAEVERQRDAANAGWQKAAQERDKARAEVNALSDRLSAMGGALAKASGLATPRPSVRPYVVLGDVSVLCPPKACIDGKPVEVLSDVTMLAVEKTLRAAMVAEIRRQLKERVDLNEHNAAARAGRVDIDYAACRARADAYAMALGIVNSVEKTFARGGA